ncbi:MAG: 50S ribosomal protein L2 [Candidatus Aminicenantes bacterium]
MGMKTYRPTTSSLRHRVGLHYEDLTTDHPYKPLLEPLKKSGGRDARGRISIRHRGGGHKRQYRVIDFKRDKLNVPGRISTIEYDPNRSAFISLVIYQDGDKKYILTPQKVKVGQSIVSSDKQVDILPGNAMPLRHIPLGMIIHNIELRRGKGGQMVKSAGAGAQVLAKEGDYAQVRMPSSEIRRIHLDCRATIGEVSNPDHQNIVFGKAGVKRWKGRRPHVRGTAMNPIDHPHGGGEGKAKGGRNPVSPTGKPTKGYRTRRNKRTKKFIVRRRSR